MMTPSDAALDLLKQFEKGPKGGFSPWPYVCPAGKQTIGWGHVILHGDRISPPLTAAQADALLLADLDQFAQGVAEHTKAIRLSQQQFDALCCLAFNIGISNFAGSTLLAKLKRGDVVGAAGEFPRWDKARNQKTGKLEPLAGLTRRREAERALFLRATPK